MAKSSARVTNSPNDGASWGLVIATLSHASSCTARCNVAHGDDDGDVGDADDGYDDGDDGDDDDDGIASEISSTDERGDCVKEVSTIVRAYDCSNESFIGIRGDARSKSCSKDAGGMSKCDSVCNDNDATSL